MKRIGLIVIFLMLAGLACSLSPENLPEVDDLATSIAGTVEAVGGSAEAIATSVAATLAAQTPQEGEVQQPTATVEDIYQTGTVNGHMCYPSEFIPAMNLYLENVDTLEVTKIPIAENQLEYSAPVPPGSYIAYAWLPDFSLGGSYSQAVPCRLSASCTDHSLISFEVVTGMDVNDVDICDWYTFGEVPYPPEADSYLGAISGGLGYPSEFIPEMYVVASNINTGQYYYVMTEINQMEYQITHLLPATYHVVAYPRGEGFEGSDFGGGYSKFVTCGLSVDCTDHSLIPVQVNAGETTTDVDPVDFYAPPDAFPPNRVE